MPRNVRPIGNRVPDVAPGSWIADTATVVGEVTIGAGMASSTARCCEPAPSRSRSGQGAMSRTAPPSTADPGLPARIDDGVSVGHGAVLHGCAVDDGCLIGMNATVLNGAVIGAESLVAANALVPEGAEIPPRSLVTGAPAKVRRALRDAELDHLRHNAEVYRELSIRHRDIV